MTSAVKCAAYLILVWLIGYLLVLGKSLLMPIIIAVFIWNLLNTLNDLILKSPWVGGRLPYWFSMVLSLLIVVVLLSILINIITNNVSDVIGASSRYQANLSHMFHAWDSQYATRLLSSIDAFVKSLNVQSILLNMYSVFSGLMGSAVLIALYVVFLFVEQHFFAAKILALFPQPSHRVMVDRIINKIAKDIQTYLGLKTILGLITALSSWVLMRCVGLDFAEFWALLILCLSYIPNIGAIIATAFPALLALIQFQSWGPFIIITSGIVTVQFIIGNLVEPRFLGKSLNLSPLIILFMLALWGSLWGILGMFLSVPITVMLMIVFAHFDATRPIAIILSQDGRIKKV